MSWYYFNLECKDNCSICSRKPLPTNIKGLINKEYDELSIRMGKSPTDYTNYVCETDREFNGDLIFISVFAPLDCPIFKDDNNCLKVGEGYDELFGDEIKKFLEEDCEKCD